MNSDRIKAGVRLGRHCASWRWGDKGSISLQRNKISVSLTWDNHSQSWLSRNWHPGEAYEYSLETGAYSLFTLWYQKHFLPPKPSFGQKWNEAGVCKSETSYMCVSTESVGFEQNGSGIPTVLESFLLLRGTEQPLILKRFPHTNTRIPDWIDQMLTTVSCLHKHS